MDLAKVIKDRRSIRKYLDREVDEKVLDELILSASLAPSGCNAQPWRFRKVLKDEIKRLEGAQAYGQLFVYTSPSLIVVCSDPSTYDDIMKGNYQVEDRSLTLNQAWHIQRGLNIQQVRREIIAYDIGLALGDIALKAVDLGLGTCFVRLQDADKIRTVLDIPSDYDIHLTVCIGYPAENPEPRPRRPIEELII